MKTTNLLIHLPNNVDAFSLKQRHIDQIRESLPDVRITVAAGNSEFMEKLPEADCALVWAFKSEWYEKAPKLKVLFTPSAGHDWVAGDPSGSGLRPCGRYDRHLTR